MAKHLKGLQKKLKILKDRLIQFIKKIVYGKTNIQKEMFSEEMLRGKCRLRVTGIRNESSWKVYQL